MMQSKKMATICRRWPTILPRAPLVRTSFRLSTTLAGVRFENVPEHPHADLPSDSEVQPLGKMPGLSMSLPLLFRLARSPTNLHLMHQEIWKALGRIYKIPIPFGQPFIVTSSPADVEMLFRTDGETPYRAGFENLEEFFEEKGLGKGLLMS